VNVRAHHRHGPIGIAAIDGLDQIVMMADATRQFLPVEARESAHHERDFDERDNEADEALVGGRNDDQAVEAIIKLGNPDLVRHLAAESGFLDLPREFA
jgi:hypothetical protein